MKVSPGHAPQERSTWSRASPSRPRCWEKLLCGTAVLDFNEPTRKAALLSSAPRGRGHTLQNGKMPPSLAVLGRAGRRGRRCPQEGHPPSSWSPFDLPVAAPGGQFAAASEFHSAWLPAPGWAREKPLATVLGHALRAAAGGSCQTTTQHLKKPHSALWPLPGVQARARLAQALLVLGAKRGGGGVRSPLCAPFIDGDTHHSVTMVMSQWLPQQLLGQRCGQRWHWYLCTLT